MADDDDIQDFAETTVNELLGWYGYEKLDARGLCPPKGHAQRDTTPSPSPSPPREEGPPTAAGRDPGDRRGRACDWCRPSQRAAGGLPADDGGGRLRFCGSGCLNQYKMHIFCGETQAYLRAHPAGGPRGGDPRSGLITPDLWLRDGEQPETGRAAPAHARAERHRVRRAKRRPAPPAHSGQRTDARGIPVSPLERSANTVMLPYPLFVPLPVPIPIPIPLSSFLPRSGTGDAASDPEPLRDAASVSAQH